MGRISYWVYLLHLVVSYVLVRWLPGRDYMVMLVLFAVIVIVVSSGVDRMYGLIIKSAETMRKKIRTN